MASDFEIRGADQFLRLSKALKAAGETGMRKELHAGMRKAARPLIPRARAAARQRLPKRGGLADQVAREPARISVRTGRDPGVRVTIGKRRGGAQSANRGVIRHPVRGGGWVEQEVPGGWFDDTNDEAAPEIRRELEKAMQVVVDKIAKEAGLRQRTAARYRGLRN